MDMPTGRRQPRRQLNANNQYSTGMPDTSGHDAFYGGGGFYDPTTAPQMTFEDPKPFAGGQPGPYYNPPHQQQQQPFQPSASASPFDVFTPMEGGQPGQPSLFNPNLMYSAGTQLFAQQAGTVINQYAQDFQSKGRSWIGQKLKYYFAVDTTYVIKKILLLFFPFTHKDWTVRFNPNEPIAPRDDINAPDLYIPSMAFVTYVLVAGFIIGQAGDFSPEKLGIQASSALGWLLLEIVAIMISLYVMSISSSLGFFHLMAFSSYKFVPMIGSLIVGYVLNSRLAYYAFTAYSGLSLSFFLMRSLHVTIQTTSTGANTPRNSLTLVMIVCALQVFLVYWLTRHLAP